MVTMQQTVQREQAVADTRPLAGKVVLVTGASSGIGAATAREVARRGACVVLAARRVADLEEQAQALRATGAEVLAVPTDITDGAQVTRLVERAMETFGQIDVLVNNAGVGWYKLLVNSPEDEIANIIDVNLLGTMLMTRAVLPGMLERRQGSIITVSSVAGRVAVEPVYSATKYGVRGFALGLRRQLRILAGPRAISVCLVEPSAIRTAQTSDMTGPLPGPEVVANTIADLILRPRREAVVPRKQYAVVWLEQLLPGIADMAYQWSHRNGLREK